ncbi:MAG: DUF4328 domain-containing protein, partial [Planctomycetota bacterium]
MNNRQHQWTYKQVESADAIGPIQEAELVRLVKNGTIGRTTLVCSETRTANKWISAGQIAALAKFFDSPQREEAKAKKAILVADPYRAPPSDSVGARTTASTQEQFQSLNSTVLVWLLRATMFVMAVHGFVFWWFFEFGYRRNSGLVSLQVGIFIIQMILVLLTGIFFLRWKHRAYKNLQVACSGALKTTAGWSVACYFIPFINLFRPATAMHEIQSRSQAKIGFSVCSWWVFYLLSILLGRVAANAPGGNDNPAGNVMTIVAISLAIVAGFLLLKIINTITEKHRRYQQSSEFASSLPIDQWQDPDAVKVAWIDSPRWGAVQLACGLLAVFGWSAISNLGGKGNSSNAQANAFGEEDREEHAHAQFDHEYVDESLHSMPESANNSSPRDVPTLVSDLIAAGENGLSGYDIRQQLFQNGCDESEIVRRLAKQLRETTDARRFGGILLVMYASSRFIADNQVLKSEVADAASNAGRYIGTQQLASMDHQAKSMILESATLPYSAELLGKLASLDDNWANTVLT